MLGRMIFMRNVKRDKRSGKGGYPSPDDIGKQAAVFLLPRKLKKKLGCTLCFMTTTVRKGRQGGHDQGVE
jgi:hypothetical protein